MKPELNHRAIPNQPKRINQDCPKCMELMASLEAKRTGLGPIYQHIGRKLHPIK